MRAPPHPLSACVPNGENASHHILVHGTEGQVDPLRDSWTAHVGFRCFMSTTAAMTSPTGAPRARLPRPRELGAAGDIQGGQRSMEA
jgi:hypothetical protein